MGNGVGQVIFKNPFSPPEERDAEERKNSQGKKVAVAPAPAPAIKKQEVKKLVSLCLRILVSDETSSPKRPRRLHQMAPLHPATMAKGDLLCV